MTARQILLFATISGALAVMVGAFGAHALPQFLQRQTLADELVARRLNSLEVGARYHMYHTLALLGLGLWLRLESLPRRWAGALFAAGCLLFSGSLYGYAMTGTRWLQAIVPLGGVAFIAGWLSWAVAIMRRAAG